MSFRIRPRRDFTQEFRRVATEELAGAVADLEEQTEGPHAAVHAMRKRLKRVRSLYRLVSHRIPDLAAQENIRLRDAAKSLSAVRDATAMIEVVDRLAQEAAADGRDGFRRIAGLLTERRDRIAETEFDLARLPAIIAALKEAGEAALQASFDASLRKNARLLEKSWRRTGRKAVAAIAACRQRAADDDFHELRKRSYDYRLHHLLLRDLWPSAMDAKHDAAKALVERLGFVNDLAVLSALIEEELHRIAGEEDITHLREAIASTARQNREEALADADRLFRDDPDEEAERIELLWIAAGSR